MNIQLKIYPLLVLLFLFNCQSLEEIGPEPPIVDIDNISQMTEVFAISTRKEGPNYHGGGGNLTVNLNSGNLWNGRGPYIGYDSIFVNGPTSGAFATIQDHSSYPDGLSFEDCSYVKITGNLKVRDAIDIEADDDGGDAVIVDGLTFTNFVDDGIAALNITNNIAGNPGYDLVDLDELDFINSHTGFRVRGAHDSIDIDNIFITDEEGLFGPHYCDVNTDVWYNNDDSDWARVLTIDGFHSKYSTSGTLFVAGVKDATLTDIHIEYLYSKSNGDTVEANTNNGGPGVKFDYAGAEQGQKIWVEDLLVDNTHQSSTVSFQGALWFQEVNDTLSLQYGNAKLYIFDVDVGITPGYGGNYIDNGTLRNGSAIMGTKFGNGAPPEDSLGTRAVVTNVIDENGNPFVYPN